MARITLTDGSGRWFSDDAAVKFGENSRWNGSNHISVNTGSQWNHEALYYTKSGNWVLNRWSQWQGSTEDYETIGEDAAIRWLCHNECWGDEGMDLLPNSVRERVTAGIAAREL